MKKLISVSLAAMMILSLLCACGGPSAELTFKGSYQPQQTEGAKAIELVLTLNSDGTLKVTPGIMLTLDDNDATKIVHDDPATGTWKMNDDESITMTITAAGDETFSMEYTVEKIDGYYEFEMMLGLMGYKRPTVMTSQ